ncbi:hypothetical protein [Streptomyces sp. AN091965]|uniref:hypothetical protein n=1 Tax=Streptomyces sp. AN091965 TaxID=2927803 RepID=UPI001F602157|nr:hypothetical protein [Streptomyces sp. AN091965]MCI3927892.1 hypothetical protein [Streptomyces sp. AN091965]
MEWFDRVGNRTIDRDPEIGVCRNVAAGAVSGTNRTNLPLRFWPRANCRDSPTFLLPAGFSWNDPVQPYFSYMPAR